MTNKKLARLSRPLQAVYLIVIALLVMRQVGNVQAFLARRKAEEARQQARDLLSSKLLTAVEHGDVKATRTLLDQGADPNVGDNSSLDCNEPVLYMAVNDKNKKIIRLLIDHGADVNLPEGSAD